MFISKTTLQIVLRYTKVANRAQDTAFTQLFQIVIRLVENNYYKTEKHNTISKIFNKAHQSPVIQHLIDKIMVNIFIFAK